jgi:hypothetical protein
MPAPLPLPSQQALWHPVKRPSNKGDTPSQPHFTPGQPTAQHGLHNPAQPLVNPGGQPSQTRLALTCGSAPGQRAAAVSGHGGPAPSSSCPQWTSPSWGQLHLLHLVVNPVKHVGQHQGRVQRLSVGMGPAASSSPRNTNMAATMPAPWKAGLVHRLSSSDSSFLIRACAF